MEQVLEDLRKLSYDDIYDLSQQVLPSHLMPADNFFDALLRLEQEDILRACLLVYYITNQTLVPRQFQLEAALAPLANQDSWIVAGTGSGKTLAMAIPALLRPGTISLVISPLKRLMLTQVNDFISYGLTAAAINEDTVPDEAFWESVRTGGFSVLIASPEQLKPFQGHIGKFAALVKDRTFTKRIKRVHVDEGHFIYTAGIKLNGLPPFRPAYGQLDEFRILLSKGTPFQVLTATAPPHMRKVINNKLLMSPNARQISLSVNRPNLVYATHPLVGGINNFKNLDCLIPIPFHPPMRLPRVVSFHEGCID